jgi:hypothetical protein
LATLQLAAQSSIPGNVGGGGIVVSPDGKTVFASNEVGELFAMNLPNLTVGGSIQTFRVPGAPQDWVVPQAIDETGLIAGPLSGGVIFVDSTQIATGPGFNLGFPLPGTGPTSGGTAIQSEMLTGNPPPASFLGKVFFGDAQAANASISATVASVTSPPSTLSGSVDFSVLLPDNTMGMTPEAFSYGPTIVNMSSTAATAEGGGAGTIWGYGFGETSGDFQLTIGTSVANITQTGLATDVPYPIRGAKFIIPPGPAGTVVDLTVKTAAGSTTAPQSFRYVAASVPFPVQNAMLQAGLFDPGRSVLYYTDQNQVQIFSLSQHAWLAPIPIPKADANTRLEAVTLSPDGTKLAVSDPGNSNVYLIDPDKKTVQGFAVRQTSVDISGAATPHGLTITNGGTIYFATTSSGAPYLHQLNTTTGIVTDLGLMNLSGTDAQDRFFTSPDGSKGLFNKNGQGFVIDTSTDAVTLNAAYASSPIDDPEMAMSADGAHFVMSEIITDSLLNPAAGITYVDRDIATAFFISGEKLSADGSLLFRPMTDGVDIIDGRTGLLLERVQLPFTMAQVYDGLTLDTTDQLLFATTSAGIEELNLAPYPQPAPPFPLLLTAGPFEHAATHNLISCANGQCQKAGSTNRPPHLQATGRSTAKRP